MSRPMEAPIRRLLAAAVVAAALATPAFAAIEDARTVAEDATERVLTALRSEEAASLKRHPERLYALVEDIILPHFAFHRMSKRVLGRYWRTANAERNGLQSLVRRLVGLNAKVSK